MKRIFKQESLILDSRFLWASIFVFAICGVLVFRLWYLQIYRGDYYKSVSERNRIRKVEIPAPRGMIYDRNGLVILGNRPFYDLVLVPQYLQSKETTFEVLSRLLHLPVSVLEQRSRQGAGRPKYLPVTLKRNLSLHEVSTIESNRVFLPGIEVRVAPRRDYKANLPAHLIGYLGEIDPKTLEILNKKDSQHSYLPGDLIGKQGLEYRWEQYLRGKNGYKLIQVDAFGRIVQPHGDEKWDLPLVPAQKGSDLELTIDFALQKSVQEAFKGKYGAAIVMNPNNGEILAMASEPGYDPTIYQRSLSNEEWYSLVNDPFKPLFDKTTGGEYIPGSIYKAVVTLAGLQEGLVNNSTVYDCPGHFILGDQVFQCHQAAGHGRVNLRTAIMKSCDVFFYHLGVELGVDKIAHYAKMLGLGKELGVNLNLERPGLIPTAAWKKLVHKIAWQPGDSPNIAIGQGYNLLTPIQMVSLYATIANGGNIWRPYLVKSITNHIGETVYNGKPELLGKAEGIHQPYFNILRSFLKAVVHDPDGTGKNAAVDDHTVAGKTGSAQVVSLKKNKDNKTDDVSVKWKEHAIFAAFSPVEKAEIAVIIVSENDAFGGGGAQAAPVARKIIRSYYDLKDMRASKKPEITVSGKEKETSENELKN